MERRCYTVDCAESSAEEILIISYLLNECLWKLVSY